jgi:hypothetical protein
LEAGAQEEIHLKLVHFSLTSVLESGALHHMNGKIQANDLWKEEKNLKME